MNLCIITEHYFTPPKGRYAPLTISKDGYRTRVGETYVISNKLLYNSNKAITNDKFDGAFYEFTTKKRKGFSNV